MSRSKLTPKLTLWGSVWIASFALLSTLSLTEPVIVTDIRDTGHRSAVLQSSAGILRVRVSGRYLRKLKDSGGLRVRISGGGLVFVQLETFLVIVCGSSLILSLDLALRGRMCLASDCKARNVSLKDDAPG